MVPIERRINAVSPIVKMKIIKNDAEAYGMRDAHIRDGAALIKYLHWLDTEIDDHPITEMSGAEQLKFYRRFVLFAMNLVSIIDFVLLCHVSQPTGKLSRTKLRNNKCGWSKCSHYAL